MYPSTKRSVYRLNDPFLLFWYRFVAPDLSRLEADLIEPVYATVRSRLAGHVAEIWEWLARESVARTALHGLDWNPAARWWGRGMDGQPLEVDVVAESRDGRNLLVGEVKWSDRSNPARVLADLVRKAEQLPFRRGRRVHYALWLKRFAAEQVDGMPIVGPEAVLRES